MSEVVLVEDGPAEANPPYSFEVLTSPYSRHGYYVLDEPLDPQQLVALSASVAKQFRGSDLSGIDRQQLVRLPNTINTKRKAGAYRVNLIDYGQIYSQHDLEASLLALNEQPTSSTNTTLPDSHSWHQVTNLNQPENLRRGGPLLTKEGALRRLKAGHFINRVLTGQSLWTERPVGYDISYSGWRYNLIKALWLHGYPQVEIRLLAEHLAAPDLWKRGTVQLQTDIDRIIGKLSQTNWRDEDACRASYRLVTGKGTERPPIPRARRGRPSTKDKQLGRLRIWLSVQVPNDWGLILVSVKDVAAALALKERSAQTYLRALRETEEIVTGQLNGNGDHYIVLTNRFQGAENPLADSHMPKSRPENETTLAFEEEHNRGAEKSLVDFSQEPSFGGASSLTYTALGCEKSTVGYDMERTPPPCPPKAEPSECPCPPQMELPLVLEGPLSHSTLPCNCPPGQVIIQVITEALLRNRSWPCLKGTEIRGGYSGQPP